MNAAFVHLVLIVGAQEVCHRRHGAVSARQLRWTSEAECVIAPRDGTLGKSHHTSLPRFPLLSLSLNIRCSLYHDITAAMLYSLERALTSKYHAIYCLPSNICTAHYLMSWVQAVPTFCSQAFFVHLFPILQRRGNESQWLTINNHKQPCI